jgi:uncharacterized damage-inducible protein DinB
MRQGSPNKAVLHTSLGDIRRWCDEMSQRIDAMSENRQYWTIMAKRTSNYLDKAKNELNEISKSYEQFWAEMAHRAPTTQPAKDNVQSKKATAPTKSAIDPPSTTTKAVAVRFVISTTLNTSPLSSLSTEQIGTCFYLSRAAQWLRERPQEYTREIKVDEILQYLQNESRTFVDLLKSMNELGNVDVDTLHRALDKRVSKDSAAKWLRLLLPESEVMSP